MGVEVVVSEMAPVTVETTTEVDKSSVHHKENGKLDYSEPIKFGSHGEEPVMGEENNAADANFPKDAVDEWPAPKQIHSFYFVRYRPYDDPKIKAKLDMADREIQKLNQARLQLTEGLRAKRSERAELLSQMKTLRADIDQYSSVLGEKKKEMEPLQQALGKLRNTNGASGRGGLCSSEEELNNLIYSFQYRIQHESIPLSEEKQLLREIKQLEGTREKVIANAAVRAKIQDSMGQKEVIQDQVKLMGADLDGVRKEQQVARNKRVQIKEKAGVLDKAIEGLQEELKAVTEKRDKAYESIQELRKQRDGGNANFYQSRSLLNKARDLAAKKDIQALDELSHAEVEKFMSQWSSSKAFRDDYEKRILLSLDMRQLSRDGRMRNPDEKPLVVPEAPVPPETEVKPKASVKPPKEEKKSSPPPETKPAEEVQKTASKKGANSKSSLEHDEEEEYEIPGLDKSQKELPAVKEVDEAKVKEMKREEEIAKAKLAMERKKKLAEKAAAKAAIRAQKEAEKKLKEREKKAKKKAASTAATNSEEPTEAASGASDSEKVDSNNDSSAPAPAPVKEKVHKENSVRLRNRAKGPDAIPRAILKRKKSSNYWLWAAPAALVLLLLLVLGYYQYM